VVSPLLRRGQSTVIPDVLATGPIVAVLSPGTPPSGGMDPTARPDRDRLPQLLVGPEGTVTFR
jgi:hypothetical protein